MPSYETGHVKRHTETGATALRTIFPEDQGQQMADMAWLVATTNTGARNLPTSAVEGPEWEDLYTPISDEPGDPE